MNYQNKYIKYKQKYLNLQYNNLLLLQNGGKNQIIIHIAGTQGSGKTTIGNKIKEKYEENVLVFDLDNLHNDYIQNTNKYENYQEYIDHIININNNIPIIFVGLDAEMCLGLMEDSDIFYNLHSNYNFYIKTSDETIKQRFYRQVKKLEDRKEVFFNDWLVNPEKTQQKIFRFVDLDKWKNNNIKCDNIYIKRNYEFLNSEKIFNKIGKILEK